MLKEETKQNKAILGLLLGTISCYGNTQMERVERCLVMLPTTYPRSSAQQQHKAGRQGEPGIGRVLHLRPSNATG